MSYPKDPNFGKGGYPQQQQAPQQQPPMMYHPAYSSAPPPYSQYQPAPGHYPPQQQYAYAVAGQAMAGVPQAPPAYSYGYPPQAQANPGYPVQPGFNPAAYGGPQPQYVAAAQFDSGARFDGIASHNIPPPPPGMAPNAAQMAAAQGGTVYATQKKADWFSGSKGGGVSFW